MQANTEFLLKEPLESNKTLVDTCDHHAEAIFEGPKSYNFSSSFRGGNTKCSSAEDQEQAWEEESDNESDDDESHEEDKDLVYLNTKLNEAYLL